jgi:serine protease inhibitor
MIKPNFHPFNYWLFSLLLSSAVVGCKKSQQDDNVHPSRADERKSAAPFSDGGHSTQKPFDPSFVILNASQRQAAQWALLNEMLKARQPNTLSATAADFAFSPFSMVNALQALWWGTRGDTAVELANLFRVDPSSAAAVVSHGADSTSPATLGGAVTLRQTSALWLDSSFPIREEYIKLLKSRGLGLAEKVDWSKTASALERVNQWGVTATQGRIPRLFEDGDIQPPVAFVLASVVSFQGAWAETFDPASTKVADFILLDGSRRPASYLQATRQVRTVTSSDEGVSLLELPFSDGRHRMIIVLPDKPGAEPLAKLEKIVADRMADWIKSLAPTFVTMNVPKFEVGSSADPQATLEALGVYKIFSEKQADFSGAVEVAGLKLDAIRHHARVKIDESGAEAVAATSASVAAKGYVPSAVAFNADHPFLFFILGEGGELLFAGRVALPNAPSADASQSGQIPAVPDGVHNTLIK